MIEHWRNVSKPNPRLEAAMAAVPIIILLCIIYLISR